MATGSNTSDGDSILGELTDHLSEVPPRFASSSQNITVNLKLYQERDQAVLRSLKGPETHRILSP